MKHSLWKTFFLIASALVISGCGADGSGNAKDTTAPVIVLNGDTTMTIAQGDAFTDPGATATDNVDASVSVTITGSVNTSSDGTYTLTYSATDTSGNEAASVTRTVTVEDSVPVTAEDAYSVTAGEMLRDDVSLNDTVSLDSPSTFAVVEGPFHAESFSLEDNGSFSYQPIDNFQGEDSFSYQITDSDGSTSTTTRVSLTQRPMILKVKTDHSGVSNDDQFKIIIDTNNTYHYSYSVDCDHDGSYEESEITTDYTCTFDTEGNHSIAIRGRFPHPYFYHVVTKGDPSDDGFKLLEVQQWGGHTWKSLDHSFDGCTQLVITAEDSPDLSHVASISHAFSSIKDITSDINSWDTHSVTDMSYLFFYLKNFNQNIGEWNTSNVTNMDHMFARAEKFNQDISGWDTANVTNMESMFIWSDAFDINLGNWDIRNVTTMVHMFLKVELPTATYDAILHGWAAQATQSNVVFDGGDSKYSTDGLTDRNILTGAPNNWRITDDGQE